jgi:hypothetical protein
MVFDTNVENDGIGNGRFRGVEIDVREVRSSSESRS